MSSDDREHLRAAYASISKTSEEQYMKTVAEQYIEEGRQEGVRLAMLKFIEHRFGSAPPALVQLIENASATEVDDWMRRILEATTLDDLLA